MHIVKDVCTPDPYKTYLHLTSFFDAFRKQSPGAESFIIRDRYFSIQNQSPHMAQK